jgi:twitching motility protein PilU
MMIASPYVADMIQKGEIHKLKDAMKQGGELGMQTFDEALYQLHVAGRIAYREAIENADSRTDLALRFRLQGLVPEAEPESIALDEFAGSIPAAGIGARNPAS